jgi:hypothetical protein
LQRFALAHEEHQREALESAVGLPAATHAKNFTMAGAGWKVPFRLSSLSGSKERSAPCPSLRQHCGNNAAATLPQTPKLRAR